MNEIGHGIEVYYENKKDVRNIVFFPNGAYKYYDTGGMLFEAITDEAMYMVTTKLKNMIRAFPEYSAPLTIESLTKHFKWLCGTIQDDDMPVVSELFRSEFTEVIHRILSQYESDSFESVGAFMDTCYTEYLGFIEAFAAFFDALAANASGIADDFQRDVAQIFISSAMEAYESYTRKCSVRRKSGNVSSETHQITNYLWLLTFEYCRLKKEGKAVKICANCGRYFMPQKRIDSIYCLLPSPQNPLKVCNKVGSQIKRAEARRNDFREREHHNIKSKLHMAAKRARDNGEETLLSGYKQALENEQRRFESIMAEQSE